MVILQHDELGPLPALIIDDIQHVQRDVGLHGFCKLYLGSGLAPTPINKSKIGSTNKSKTHTETETNQIETETPQQGATSSSFHATRPGPEISTFGKHTFPHSYIPLKNFPPQLNAKSISQS